MSDTPQITIYGAEWCPPCHATKDYLKKHNIAYTYRNVDEDQEALLEAVNKSQQRGIPVIDIDGEIIVGFDRPRIDAALNLK